MRMLAIFLIVIAAIYFWDVQYNNETLSNGARSMGRSISHSFGTALGRWPSGLRAWKDA